MKIHTPTQEQSAAIVMQVEAVLIRNAHQVKRRRALQLLGDKHVLARNSTFKPHQTPVLRRAA